jgi:regulation of enolase protein 1 (concanavalin A-like superfamily)
VTGSGTDVWGTADAFHYAYRALTGDGTIVARVASVQQNVNAWVKAGVMIRETLDPGSAHAFMLVSASKGVAFQRRGATGGISTSTAGTLSAAPQWVKLARNGDLFSAYESADGVNWTLVGTDNIPMGTTVFVGLAVTSHTTGSAATCTFDGVSLQ